MNDDAVRIDSSSSSRVVAPSYRPAMVLSATRMGSTSGMPSQQRVTARTILLTSTGSCSAGALGDAHGIARRRRRAQLERGLGEGMREEAEACRFMTMFPGSKRNSRQGAANGCVGTGVRAHSGRSSHESSKATSTPHGMPIAAGLRTSGRGPTNSADSYCMPLPDPKGLSFENQCQGMVRSQLPLRGSSGFAPDSLLTQQMCRVPR